MHCLCIHLESLYHKRVPTLTLIPDGYTPTFTLSPWFVIDVKHEQGPLLVVVPLSTDLTGYVDTGIQWFACFLTSSATPAPYGSIPSSPNDI